MKVKLCAVLLFFSLFILNVHSEDLVLTPEKVIELSRKQSTVSENASLEVNIADYDTKAAVASFFPSLSAQGTYSRLSEDPADLMPDMSGLSNIFGPGIPDLNAAPPQDIIEAAISISIPLYTGKKTINGLRAAKSNLESQKFLRERVLDQAEASALKLFWALVATKEGLIIAKETLQWYEKLINDQKIMFETGMILELELLKSKTNLAQIKLGVLNAENEIMRLHETIHDFLNLDQDINLIIKYPEEIDSQSIQIPDNSNFDSLIHARNDIIAIDHQIESLEAIRNIYRASYIPNLYGFFNPTLTNNNPYENNDFKASWIAGARVNWIIYDWGKNKQEILKSDTRIEQLRLSKSSQISQIRSEINSAYRSLEESIEALKIAKGAVVNSKRALEIAELQYKEGMITDISLTETRKSLTEAQVQVVQTRIQKELAAVSFKFALGN